MTESYKIRYLDPHTGSEMQSAPEASLAAAVSVARALEKQGCVIRAIVTPDGETGWEEAPLSVRAARLMGKKLGRWWRRQET